jgi:carbamoyltransferase
MARQIFEYHPLIGYRFIPGIKARIPHGTGGYLIRTNNLGFRCDHDVLAQKPQGVRRVLLFGDSFTAGDRVSNGKRYSDLLEQRIPDLQVDNFGLPGTGTDQHYLAYDAYARKLEHDLLVISVLVENIRRVAARYRPYLNDRGETVLYAKPYYELEGGELVLRNVPVPRDPLRDDELDAEELARVDRGGRFEKLRGVIKQLGLREMVQRATQYQPVPAYNRADDPDWLVMRAILERWIRGHPRPVIVMPIPLYQHVEGTSDPSAYQARFAELQAATGCTLHDPLPDLQSHSPEERRGFRFGEDPHPTPAGHAALADSLARAIEAVAGRPEENAAS